MSLVPIQGGTGLVQRPTRSTDDDFERQPITGYVTITLKEMEKMQRELLEFDRDLADDSRIRALEYLFQFFQALYRYCFAHLLHSAFYLIAVGWLDTWYVTLFLWFAVEVFYNDCVLHPLSLHPGGEYGNTLGSWVEHIFWQFVMLVIVFTAIPVFEAILVFLGPCFDSVARMYGAVCIFLMAGKWILDSVVWWLGVLVPVLSLPVGSFMGTYKVFSFFTDTASKSSGWSDGWFPRGSDDFGAYTEAWKSLMQIVRGCVWLHKVYTWCTGGPVVWGFQLLAAISGWWNRPT